MLILDCYKNPLTYSVFFCKKVNKGNRFWQFLTKNIHFNNLIKSNIVKTPIEPIEKTNPIKNKVNSINKRNFS